MFFGAGERFRGDHIVFADRVNELFKVRVCNQSRFTLANGGRVCFFVEETDLQGEREKQKRAQTVRKVVEKIIRNATIQAS